MIDTNFERWGATLKEAAPTNQPVYMNTNEAGFIDEIGFITEAEFRRLNSVVKKEPGKNPYLPEGYEEALAALERINTYTCSAGHVMVTRDIDEGVTPMFVACPSCEFSAKSAFYRVEPGLTPSHEWYKPKHPERLRADLREHVVAGGLVLRQIGQPDETEAEDNGKPLPGVKINLKKSARFSSVVTRALTNNKKK